MILLLIWKSTTHSLNSSLFMKFISFISSFIIQFSIFKTDSLSCMIHYLNFIFVLISFLFTILLRFIVSKYLKFEPLYYCLLLILLNQSLIQSYFFLFCKVIVSKFLTNFSLFITICSLVSCLPGSDFFMFNNLYLSYCLW